MTVRRLLHHHWYDSGALWREIERNTPDSWLDRQTEWCVDREGDHGDVTIPLRLYARFICWLTDWRTTWRIRP